MSQGTNLDLLLGTDYLSTQDQKLLQEENEKEKISLGEGISLAIKQEQILPSILKSFSQEELEPNYNFRIDDKLLNQILVDDNPQRIAEVLATIDEGLNFLMSYQKI